MWLSNKHTHTRMPRERRFINNSNMPQTTFAYMLVQKKLFFYAENAKAEEREKVVMFVYFFPSFLLDIVCILAVQYVFVCVCLIWNALKARSLSRHSTLQSFLCCKHIKKRFVHNSGGMRVFNTSPSCAVVIILCSFMFTYPPLIKKPSFWISLLSYIFSYGYATLICNKVMINVIYYFIL